VLLRFPKLRPPVRVRPFEKRQLRRLERSENTLITCYLFYKRN